MWNDAKTKVPEAGRWLWLILDCTPSRCVLAHYQDGRFVADGHPCDNPYAWRYLHPHEMRNG